MMPPRTPRPHVYGAYCPRCNRAYTTTQVPLPTVCDWCSTNATAPYDMPMGFGWVSS